MPKQGAFMDCKCNLSWQNKTKKKLLLFTVIN